MTSRLLHVISNRCADEFENSKLYEEVINMYDVYMIHESITQEKYGDYTIIINKSNRGNVTATVKHKSGTEIAIASIDKTYHGDIYMHLTITINKRDKQSLIHEFCDVFEITPFSYYTLNNNQHGVNYSISEVKRGLARNILILDGISRINSLEKQSDLFLSEKENSSVLISSESYTFVDNILKNKLDISSEIIMIEIGYTYNTVLLLKYIKEQMYTPRLIILIVDIDNYVIVDDAIYDEIISMCDITSKTYEIEFDRIMVAIKDYIKSLVKSDIPIHKFIADYYMNKRLRMTKRAQRVSEFDTLVMADIPTQKSTT